VVRECRKRRYTGERKNEGRMGMRDGMMGGLSAARRDIQTPRISKPSYFRTSRGKSEMHKTYQQGSVKSC
jgi:hypothetical protein